MAIVFRIIFIAIGVVLVERFHWLLYIFGVFLIYTGVKIFAVKHDQEFDPEKNPVYKFLNRFLPIYHHDVSGKMVITRHDSFNFSVVVPVCRWKRVRVL